MYKNCIIKIILFCLATFSVNAENKIVLFSRRLENITQYYPDIVENVKKSLSINEGIFEAEIDPVNENTGEFIPYVY